MLTFGQLFCLIINLKQWGYYVILHIQSLKNFLQMDIQIGNGGN